MLSLQNFLSLRYFSELKLTLGVIMRVTVDVGSIWVAFLTSWLLTDERA